MVLSWIFGIGFLLGWPVLATIFAGGASPFLAGGGLIKAGTGLTSDPLLLLLP